VLVLLNGRLQGLTILQSNFKKLLHTQFLELTNCNGSVEIFARDTTCKSVTSFVKIGSGIEKLIGGDRHRA
jgi:hypothetical protein